MLAYAYTLIEVDIHGGQVSEVFGAPSDDVAVERALDVVCSVSFQVWRGETLIAELPGPYAEGWSGTLH